MELGALICTAARPACERCPVAASCAWRLSGAPTAGSPRRAQPYEGSDRQARGAILAALRKAAGPLPAADLDVCWPEAGQRARALLALENDGLITRHQHDVIGLIGDTRRP
jgi:A/G-specific adenine glycosylase